ncbi:UTRA domain-containing protein, partial [Rhodococcus erythropolis]|nr:UTRA domain-containing protein [Rhodococcus erythropolis]
TFERMSADDGLATELGIEVGDSVVHLERVLFADGEKIGLESTFLPDSRFGEMLDAFDATTSLYAAIRSIGVVFASATERIETVLASPREATLVES